MPRFHRPLLLALTTLLLLGATGCQTKPLRRFEFVQPKWGTAFRIVLYAPDEVAAKGASDAAFARVDEIGRAVNDYDPQSEVSRLSRMTADGPMTQPVAVSRDLYWALDASMAAAIQSEGAFDPTVGPLVRLWRRSRELGQLPTPDRLEKTRPSVGYRNVKVIGTKVQLLAPRMRLDFGGIATGYATLEALIAMKARGVRRALIDAGGDLAAGDPPPGEAAWRVAIQGFPDAAQVAGYVGIRNAAISTSGDTYRYVEIDGVRYSHIVDPATGLGLTRRVGVTVIADTGITADWLDTALAVMEPAKGIELVEGLTNRGAAARITTIEDGSIKVYESARFKAFRLATPAEPSPPRGE